MAVVGQEKVQGAQARARARGSRREVESARENSPDRAAAGRAPFVLRAFVTISPWVMLVIAISAIVVLVFLVVSRFLPGG